MTGREYFYHITQNEEHRFKAKISKEPMLREIEELGRKLAKISKKKELEKANQRKIMEEKRLEQESQ